MIQDTDNQSMDRIQPPQSQSQSQSRASRAFPALIAVLFTGLFTGLLPDTTAHAAADRFQLSLTGGSVITVEMEGQDIQWTNVALTGEMTTRKIAFSNIDRLILSLSPASQQVAEVRRLIGMLESPDYLKRELAEEKLSDSEIGGKFKSLIKMQADHKKYEVRYRIDRILTQLDSDSQQTGNEFDKLTLADGTVVEGDAGKFTLNCSYRGQQMTFARADIRMISAPANPGRPQDAIEKTQVRMFHDHVGNFYLPDQIKVDFEQAPNGAELAKFADVTDLFTPIGLKLGAEKKGSVVVSGFPFRFAPLPPAANSVCVYESLGSYSKRFKGIMEIRFCMPNQAAVPAGVHEFGLFLGRVNHSRDFILEAYNADGQLLASVESTDRPCVFAGVKSTELITKLRVLSNPYLFRVDRIIDEDYAVDDICFSAPTPIIDPADSEPGVVRLKNGDLLKANEIRILDSNAISVRVNEQDPLTINMDELASVRFDRNLDGPKEPGWMAALPDRTVLLVEPGDTFESPTFNHLRFKPDDLLAIWSSRNPARFPEANDFQMAEHVMVFPTCRIATSNLEFSAEGYAWQKPNKIEQPVRTTDEEDDDEDDPTPDLSSVDFADSSPESIPTIWMDAPSPHAAGTGQVRLIDGQQIVLGGQTGFSLAEIRKDAITVSVKGKSTEIPIAQVVSIQFPAISN